MSVWQARTVTTWEQALLSDGGRKSEVAWVQLTAPQVGQQPIWLIWQDDAMTVVTGGDEQPDPGFVDGGTSVVVIRSKDKEVRLMTIEVLVHELTVHSDDWQAAAEALHAKRLNSVDGEDTTTRWRTTSRLWRLTPTGKTSEMPGAMSSDSHRAAPVATSATTDSPPPLMVGRKVRRRPL